MALFELTDYTPEWSDACLELEKRCIQGGAFRLSFIRSQFHLRAACNDNWKILLATRGRKVLGTVAWAIKPVEMLGKSQPAVFSFDLRTDPEFRRQGIGMHLTRESFRRARAEGATLRYGYCFSDNHITQHIAHVIGGLNVGYFRYLVFPVYRPLTADLALGEAPPQEIHSEFLSFCGPFDFYSWPGRRLDGHVGSYRVEGAGCSVWSYEGILEERVEATPALHQFARKAFLRWPLNLRKWPNIPAPGDRIRSWYVYDFYSQSNAATRALLGHLNNLALGKGIGYLSFVCTGDPDWYRIVRAEAPPLITPALRYSLLLANDAGTTERLARIYPDIRDI